MILLDSQLINQLQPFFDIRPTEINPLIAQLNPICHLLALLGAHHILHVSRIRVKTKISLNTCIKLS